MLLSSLGLVLFIWWRVEGTLSIDNITARRTELFYWLAILLSNTLGTALGDLLASGAGLGFSGGSVLIGGLLALVVLARYLTPISSRSEEHTSELQSLMRISYAVFCLNKKKTQ